MIASPSPSEPLLPRGVRRALDAMRTNAGRDWSVSELADVAGVSSRTLQRQFRVFLGKVPRAALRDIRFESARRELNGLILKVSKRKWAVIGKKEMYLVKVGSNVTALREFTALCSVDTLPMKQFLLGQHLEKAENRRKLSRNQPIEQLLQQMGGVSLGDGFLNYASKKFNNSQLTAIAASAHEYGEGGFTLIKGPPGTGSELSRAP